MVINRHDFILNFISQLICRLSSPVEMEFIKLFAISVAFCVLKVQGKSVTSDQECGHQFVAQGLAYGAERTKYLEWPWLIALKYREKNKDDFFCGGSLVSKRHVITGEARMKQETIYENVANQRNYSSYHSQPPIAFKAKENQILNKHVTL